MSSAAAADAPFAPGRTVLATLGKGTDLLEEIERLARDNDLALSGVTAIGSLVESHVTYYDQTLQTDRELAFERPMMLVGLSGTVLRADDGIQIHCHVVLGDELGMAFGGDLSSGCVVFSCELMLTELVGPATSRVPDTVTGLSHFAFGGVEGG